MIRNAHKHHWTRLDGDNTINGNLPAQLVLCTSEIRQSPALALYCLTIWFARNLVKLVVLFPCDGQTFPPLANTLIGTEMVRTGMQRSRQLFEVTHTDEFSLRSTFPAGQKQPCMCKEGKKQDTCISLCGLIADTSYRYPHPYLLLHNYIFLTSHALQCARSGERTLYVCAGLGTGGPAFLKLEAWRAALCRAAVWSHTHRRILTLEHCPICTEAALYMQRRKETLQGSTR